MMAVETKIEFDLSKPRLKWNSMVKKMGFVLEILLMAVTTVL